MEKARQAAAPRRTGFSLTEEIRTLMDLIQPRHQHKPVIKPVRPTAHVIMVQGGMVKGAGIESAEDRTLQEGAVQRALGSPVRSHASITSPLAVELGLQAGPPARKAQNPTKQASVWKGRCKTCLNSSGDPWFPEVQVE